MSGNASDEDAQHENLQLGDAEVRGFLQIGIRVPRRGRLCSVNARRCAAQSLHIIGMRLRLQDDAAADCDYEQQQEEQDYGAPDDDEAAGEQSAEPHEADAGELQQQHANGDADVMEQDQADEPDCEGHKGEEQPSREPSREPGRERSRERWHERSRERSSDRWV